MFVRAPLSWRLTTLLFASGSLASVTACGGEASAPLVDPSHLLEPAADIAELEIRSDWIDRFTSCPPPGALGQNWVPAPFAWSAPASSAPPPVEAAEAAAQSVPGDAASADLAAAPTEGPFVSRTQGRTPTEEAAAATHREFRGCFRRALVHAPTQDGHVAIVLRVGADGRVAKVEEYAACELAPEALSCMKGVAARLRFPPPASGTDTITLPSAFTSRDGISRSQPTPNDVYTAGAYVTLETARPGLHACEEQARREHRPLQATGTFTLEIGANGHVVHAHVDPWAGEQSILACAAQELEKLSFAPPPQGKGIVIARLNFNPRQGTR